MGVEASIHLMQQATNPLQRKAPGPLLELLQQQHHHFDVLIQLESMTCHFPERARHIKIA
jgi:hypothetical protein